ncbi:DNA adenine methylase [Citrobacter sp. BDA59-3]|uniref:DNA adenine methylase n=1 Tax=Citrobacter sp. BDA59-3 TaxID=2781952 RepID=UPI001882EACE|nr:DNA adenine methylase [Citrobacter sp. BDA59-3]QOV67781.1 DNA adenine methylase [Citrobacter sp. BDA59-3]
MSTILKWAGNKTAVMHELLEHLPAAGSRLVEPFAGSCAVMMATDYPAYLIADINPDLINMYRVISSDTDKFIELARAMFGSHSLAESYYRVREAFNYDNGLDCLHRAVYFLYLNRHGYRGLCRYNKSGRINVPFGNYKGPYFPETEIRAFAEKAKRATFICASFDETLGMLKTGDVIYCDPPYDGTFSNYHTSGFGEDEQYHLASILVRRSSQGYPVIASNADTSLVASLYHTFTLHRITAPRSINIDAGGGKIANEIIAVSRHRPIWSGVDLAKGRDWSAGVQA